MPPLRFDTRASRFPQPTTATFDDTVAAILLEEHAIESAFLCLTGPAMINVIDGALDLVLPLLKEMAAQRITYEELASRELDASTMMGPLDVEVPVIPILGM